MATSPDSQDDLTLAWATPVSLAQIGARLAAYAETKGAITAFRLAIRDTSLPAFHNLPEEIIGMIASEVRDVAFERKMKKWIKISRCLANTCTSMSHVSKVNLTSIAKWYPPGVSDELLGRSLERAAEEEHHKD